MPANSVKFETISSETYIGYIEKEAVEVKNKSQDAKLKPQAQEIKQQSKSEDVKYESGLIKFDFNGETQQIPYYSYNVIQSSNNQKTNKTVFHYLDRVYCIQPYLRFFFHHNHLI